MPKIRKTKASESLQPVATKPSPEQKELPDLPQPAPLPDYDKQFKPISDYIIECNPETEWPLIERWLKQNPKTVEETLGMLNEQPGMLVRATRLFLLSEREFKRFEIDWKDRTEILRSAARDYWESQKEAGMRKQITNDMIEDWIIENYGNTYKEMQSRLQDMKNVKKLMERLASQVEAREPSLRRIVERMDRKTTPGFMSSQTRKGK